MTSMVMTETALQALTVDFFKRSAGNWKSQRRYYTLNQDIEPQEVESLLTITFLEAKSPELIELAKLHELEILDALSCGTMVRWESKYTNNSGKPNNGSTVFGILGDKLYRDRGFATSKPIIATCSFINPQTMTLRTEYGGSVFEEEVKLVGTQYRTRQTIISRAGKELTIGQYLEKRI
jgi:hypothetical protein